MTKRKKSALEALDAFETEQRERQAHAQELRRAAALELGMAVLDAGGLQLGLPTLRRLVAEAVKAGGGTAEKPVNGSARHG